MSLRPLVSYPKDLREKAKQDKRYMVTVSVNGSLVKGGGITVQRLADFKMAKEVAGLAGRILPVKLRPARRTP